MDSASVLLDRAALPSEPDSLKDIIVELAAQVESLKLQVSKLRRTQFGVSSERVSGQAELFVEMVTGLPLPASDTQRISYERRRCAGRPKLPEDLPRRRVEYDLSETEKAQFDSLLRIGEEICETLDYTPAQVLVVEHVRAKYRCEKNGESTIRTAAAEPSPIAKSNASAGLLAQVLVAKYADGLPLNRQERIFRRHGVELARATLCDWILGCSELLAPLLEQLRRHVLGAPVIFADDTTLDLIQGGRGAVCTARLWAYVGAGAVRDAPGSWHDYPRGAYFEFTHSREAIHPTRFLADYRGYLQADDYAGYHATFRSGRVLHVACWAHARRRFHEIAQAQPSPALAHEALGFIAGIYQIEARAKDHPPDERGRIRQAQTVPLLWQFKGWLEAHYSELPPRGPLAQAIGYVLSNWQALTRFTDDGMLAADSNLVERTIRPIANGRKAWLFTASDRGGRAAASAFSLIETCKLNGVEPFAYLKDVLSRINSHRVDRLHELLPFHWKPTPAA